MALPRVTINRESQLHNVIIDSDVTIPLGLVVGENLEDDTRRFRRTENGIVLITQAMIDALER